MLNLIFSRLVIRIFCVFLFAIWVTTIVASTLGGQGIVCADFSDTSVSRHMVLFDYLYSLRDEDAPDAWLGYPAKDEEPQWGVEHGFIYDTEPREKINVFYLQLPTDVGMGAIQIMKHPDNFDIAWLFIYKTVAVSTASDGRFAGSHPCTARLISLDQAIDMIFAARYPDYFIETRNYEPGKN